MSVIVLNTKNMQNELPRFLTESTIFFGRRGSGKTGMLAGVQEFHKQDPMRFAKAKKARAEKGLPPFPENHCTFSNIEMKSNYFGGGKKTSYFFDPFKFMIANSNFEYQQIVEYGVYAWSEVQKNLNSYNYQKIPTEVYAAFENLRAMNVIVNMDVQRLVRVAPSIREIYTSFVRPVQIRHHLNDKTGRIEKTEFFYFSFESWTDAEKFVDTFGENESQMLKSKELKSYTFDFNVFDCYDSLENKSIFYPKPATGLYKPKTKFEIITFDRFKNGEIETAFDFVKIEKQKQERAIA